MVFWSYLLGSMKPEIENGEFIIIKQCDNYEAGDIVTYEEENCLVTHRIIEKINNQFLAKGDANNKEDNIKDDDKIIGKVVFHSIFLGRFVRKYLKLTIILFVLFIIIINLYFILKNKNFKEENNNIEK